MAGVLQCLFCFTVMVHIVLCRVRDAKAHMEVFRSPHALVKNVQDKNTQISKLSVRENPYATSEDKVIRDRDVLEITEMCKNTNFCLEGEVHNYPEKLAEEFVLQGNVTKAIDHIRVPPQIQQRLSPGNNQVVIPICPAQRKLIFPKTLKDDEGVHHCVLNPKSRPVQGFYVELCEMDETTKQPKSYNPLVTLTFQNGYKSTGCQQHYIYRMVALIEGEKLVWKPLPLPGWCSFDITTDK